MAKKRCKKCKSNKSLKRFPKDTNSKDKRYDWCSACIDEFLKGRSK